MYNSYERKLAGYKRFELHPGHKGYPAQLENLGHQSPVIYGVGNPEVLNTPLISIIGARKATPYGLACAQMAGRIAAESGITVVSGGAIGCDSASQTEALKAGGKVIVVPGCGPDILYPRSSDKLFVDAIETGGCVLSNLEWGMEPRAGTFISRNEIIAALSQCLIVCEAGLKSGTFTTASKAADLGKKIYAVPGSIFSPTSSGTNHLLETGASIISDAQALEMLISIDYGRLRLVQERKLSKQDPLLLALIASPMRTEEIASFSKLSIPDTFALIADLEAAGIIERQLDGRYCASTKMLISM